MADKDLLAEAQELFRLSSDAEAHNRIEALDDLRFARLGEQWPEKVKKDRERKGRPCLTINRMPAFMRQVINDARQNKPSIKTRPVDSFGDIETAKIIDGLIRHIESNSNADVAYDTACEYAVGSGRGAFRISIDYACDDSFDQDILIERIANPFSVYGDHKSTAADASDWDYGFITEMIPKKTFERDYPDAVASNWDTASLGDNSVDWYDGDQVRIAEWFTRDKVKTKLLKLADGTVALQEDYDRRKVEYTAAGIAVIGDRDTFTHKVKRRIVCGHEVLKEDDWPGKLIPIVPVYGEEFWIEGKRYWRSLIRDAKDPQRMLNYWRTVSTEMVALAPKAPFIGPRGAFTGDQAKWGTANVENHAYIEYDGSVPPQRQPFPAVPAGALQEALNATDDIKSVIGIYDASLGARSNEQSGKAIMARDRQADTSTFHFIDNLTRAIRYAGKVVIDLIPHVYSGERIVRVLGEDGKASQVHLGGGMAQGQKQPFDLTMGKYDLDVRAGPSFATRRVEAAEQITALIQANPAAAPLLSDVLAKNMDWPEADKVAARFHAMLPPQIQQMESEGGDNAAAMAGQLQQMSQQMQMMQQELQKAQQEAQGQQVAMQKAQADAQLAQQKAQADIALQREKMAAEIQLQREKAAAELELRRQQAAGEAELQQFNAQMSAHRDMASMAMKDEQGPPEDDKGYNDQQLLVEVVKALTAPKRLVRDEAGRAVGVETVIGE